MAHKIYELDEALDLYINQNGISLILKNQEEQNNDNKENEAIIDINSDNEKDFDKQIEKDFLDDINQLENELDIELTRKIKRYQKIVNMLKQKYNYKCQLCGYSFIMDNGNNYCEAHHIKMLSKDGSQSPENVIILCANHHRMFHYASNIITIGDLIDNKRLIKIDDEEFRVKF